MPKHALYRNQTALSSQYHYFLREILCPFLTFQETQVHHVVEAGFKEENIKTELLPITPEPGCRYYSHNVMIAPTIVKEGAGN